MNWIEAYTKMDKPDLNDVKDFANNELYVSLCTFWEVNYKIPTKMEYSRCSLQPD